MNKLIKISRDVFIGGGFLAAATMFVNFLNFVYNAYLGRVLSLSDFGLITFINTLVSLITIFIGASVATVTHRTAYLATNVSTESSFLFMKLTQKKIFMASIVLTVLWILLIPITAKFFNIGDYTSMIIFSPIIILSLNEGVLRGYLQGNLLLVKIAFVLISEAVSKLIFAFIIVQFGFPKFAYVSIPLSVIVAFLGMYAAVFFKGKIDISKLVVDENHKFPRRFFVASAVSGLATTGFLTLDLVLVKHFFLPASAGEYSLLSLAGKMIFLLGTLFNVFILTYVSRDLGRGKNPNATFYKLFAGTTIISGTAYIFIGLLGGIFVPLLFGAKAILIVPYLRTYCLAILLFTISNAFVTYHLVRHHYSFSILILINSILMVTGIYFFHSDIGQVVQVLFTVSIFNFFSVVLMHAVLKRGKFMLRSIVDLIDIVRPIPNQQEKKSGRKRILIFNWRDTKHKFSGGAEVYIHELAKRWVEMGNSVTQFCGNDGHTPRNEVVDGVQIVRRGGFYFVYVWAFLYYVLRFRNKYDVIIDCENGVPFFTPLYAKEKVRCLMFHVHQDVFRESLIKPLASFAELLENRLMPWAYKKTKFITISESSKEEIMGLGLGKKGIEIVYPGIDLSTYKPGNIKTFHPLILYMGRLKFYKSVDVLIHSAKRILKQFPTAEIVIAGEGEEKAKLKQLAVKLGIRDRVKFLGKVTEKRKINLYQKAWVVVNPSMKEGWGITTIEANACGTPVVASDVPGLRDSVRNPTTGFLVEYGKSNKFAVKIMQLINDDKLREDMVVGSIKWAQNFEWGASARLSLRLIL